MIDNQANNTKSIFSEKSIFCQLGHVRPNAQQKILVLMVLLIQLGTISTVF